MKKKRERKNKAQERIFTIFLNWNMNFYIDTLGVLYTISQ